MTPAGSPGQGEDLRPNALVDAKVWSHLQGLALRLPPGHPGRIIATEPRPTLADYLSKLPLYTKLLEGFPA